MEHGIGAGLTLAGVGGGKLAARLTFTGAEFENAFVEAAQEFSAEMNQPMPSQFDPIGPGSLKPYANYRPKYASGQVESVWEANKQLDGNVYNANTGELLTWDKSLPRSGQWDMGHIRGQKYSDLHAQYMRGDLSLQDFLNWYRNAKNYVPELPANNRSHRYE